MDFTVFYLLGDSQLTQACARVGLIQSRKHGSCCKFYFCFSFFI